MRYTTTIALFAVLTLGLGACPGSRGRDAAPARIGQADAGRQCQGRQPEDRIHRPLVGRDIGHAQPGGSGRHAARDRRRRRGGQRPHPASAWKLERPSQGARAIATSTSRGARPASRSSSYGSAEAGGRVKIVGGKGRWPYQVIEAADRRHRDPDQRHHALVRRVHQPEDEEGQGDRHGGHGAAACPCQTVRQHVRGDPGDGLRAQRVHQSRLSRERRDRRRPRSTARRTPTRTWSASPSLYGVTRVEPFAPQESFLWQKLAAADATSFDLGGKGSPMPQGLAADLPGRARTRSGSGSCKGAPQDGVVPDTETLLERLPAEARAAAGRAARRSGADQGVQFHAPPWEIPAQQDSEGAERRERGLLLDLLQPDRQGPAPVHHRLSRRHLRRSDQSDEEVLHLQPPAAAPVAEFAPQHHPHLQRRVPRERPGLGIPVQRRHRARRHGLRSDAARRAAPAGADCGGGFCRGKVVKTVACTFGYGPKDFEGGVLGNGSAVAPSFSGSQQPQFERINPDGAFSILPDRGHHRVELARLQRLRHADHQPAVAQPLVHEPTCATPCAASSTAPTSSCRTCRRSRRSSTVARCCSGRARGSPTSARTPTSADGCSASGGRASPSPATARRTNPGACLPEPTPPIMVTTEYNDPAQLIFKTPLALDGDDPASRRFKFCSIYDNGHTDPATVKRNSTSPVVLLGGKCFSSPPRPGQTHLLRQSQERRRKRQSPATATTASATARRARTTACATPAPLRGGVSTEDEMFILIGSYYCDRRAGVPHRRCVDASRDGPDGVRRSGRLRGGEDCTTDADCPTRLRPVLEPLTRACGASRTTGALRHAATPH